MSVVIERRATEHKNNALDTLHPILKRVYSARGVQSLTDLERELSALQPFQSLQDIMPACQLLAVALQQQQRILIVGDFDADGATSSSLAVRALKLFGAKHVRYLVPNRFEFGYGLTPEIVQVALRDKPEVLITVDNGIASFEGVAFAKKQGIKVIITDHHLPAEQLPQADAIVNPNRQDDTFPSKNLAGVGVIFYVMLALRSYLRSIDWFQQQQLREPNMAQFLDLVALGTIADVVNLDKNNRILVHQGIHRIRSGQCVVGIKALLQVAGKNFTHVTASDLAYLVAPRLNAAGRLDDMSHGIECLLNDDLPQALSLAQQLDQLNYERRRIEVNMQEQAVQALQHLQLQQQQLPYGLCLYDEKWHQGVIGIVAGRIKDKYHRPVIAFASSNQHELKGSARSIKDLHIRDTLAAIAIQYPHLISKFGGHAMAAGLTIAKSDFAEFSQAFNAAVAARVNSAQLQNRILTDGEIAADYFNIELAMLLRDSGPWGQNFPEPLFEGNFQVLQQKMVADKHLKLILAMPESRYPLQAIFFNIDRSQWPKPECRNIHAVYRLDVNEYRGIYNLQLLLEHIAMVGD